jgi:predicted TIM-barrel fold metal-dependent hydrolase
MAGDMLAERLMVVSSDGHAGAEIDDFREYLDPAYRHALDDYARAYKEIGGGRSTDFEPMSKKVTDVELAAWKQDFLDTGRLEGYSDPNRRCAELNRDGVAGEVLFPDFGIPFAPFPPSIAARVGNRVSSVDQLIAGFRAYNRWLLDFCAAAPERFAGQAVINFQDPRAAVADIRWAKEQGFVGVVFAMAPGDKDLYDLDYEPVWAAAEEARLPINFHVAISTGIPSYKGKTETFAALRIVGTEVMDIAHRVLTFLIWGGVLERYPNLRVVFTEQHSDWVIGHLARMDHSYYRTGRSEIRDICKLSPSEYFDRQCYLGSSIFSRGEIRARAQIGVDKMMLGMDYPHYEGTFRHDTREYLRATVGVEHVPEAEARKLLGETAVDVFGLDTAKFAATAAEIGPTYADIMAPPKTQEMRGDVLRPLQTIG